MNLDMQEFMPLTEPYYHIDSKQVNYVGWITHDLPNPDCLSCQAGTCTQKIVYLDQIILVVHGSYLC